MTQEEFAQAARTYGNTVYRVALHALNSPQDAEDVMQTVLLKLYECRKEFESEEHRKYWILRVAVNESRKVLRSFWRRTSVPLEEWRETAAPEDPAKSEVLEAVMALEPKYRVSVYLYYYEGLTVAEVAAANPEGVAEFVANIAAVIHVDQYRTDLTTTDGEHVIVYSHPSPSVENRDGRAILVIDGEDVADVTDALNQDRRYEHDVVTEKTRMHITVEGTIEDWTVTLSIDSPDGEAPFVITTDSKGHKMSEAPATSYDDDVGVSVYDYDGEALEIITKS